MKRILAAIASLLIAAPTMAADVTIWLWPSLHYDLSPPAMYLDITIRALAPDRLLSTCYVAMEYDSDVFTPSTAAYLVPTLDSSVLVNPTLPFAPACSGMGSGTNKVLQAQFDCLGSTCDGVDITNVTSIGYVRFTVADTLNLYCNPEPIKIYCGSPPGIKPTQIILENPHAAYTYGTAGIAIGNACVNFWYSAEEGCAVQPQCPRDGSATKDCAKCPPTISPAEAVAAFNDGTFLLD